MGQKADVAALQKQYPKKDLVFLNYDTEVNLELDNGKITITKYSDESKLLLTEKARLYEKESINYYDANEITDIMASCQVPNGKKYKTHKVKDFNTVETISERYFYDDSYSIQFEYPNVTEGAICRVAYTQLIDNPIFMPSIFMANYVPIIEMNIKISVDEGIDLLIHEFNMEKPLKFKKTKKGKKTIYELQLRDIETVNIEGGGRSFQAVVPHIALAIASYEVNGKKKRVMGELDDLFATYSKFIDKVKTDTDKDFKATVDSIVVSGETELEKVNLIYDWVKTNIKYIAFEDSMGGFIPRDPQTVYQRKFGDCKDMSSIIVKMLDVAGIKGHYAWVGTRDLPYKYTDACGTFIDNHMIAVYYSEANDQYYYLDATNEYLPFGLVPPHIQEKQVMVYQGPSSYKILDSGVTACEENLNYENCRLKIEGEKLVGHFNINLDGYQIPDYQYIFGNMSKEQLNKRYQTYFAKGSNKSTLTNIEINDELRPLDINYDITIGDYIARTENEIYVNMNLDKLLENQKIPESRKQALDLEKTYNFKKKYILEIPQGYELTYVPEDVSLGDEDFSCSIQYFKNDNELTYSYNFCQGNLWLEPNQFPKWNNFIKDLKKSYRENIILTKK